MEINNKELYEARWKDWVDMKKFGPASRWLRSLFLSIVKNSVDNEEVKTILDVGCGEGTNTFLLATTFPGAIVTGIDVAESGINCAVGSYKKDNLYFFYDPESKNLDNKYDLITCFEVLEHIDNWQDFLSKIAKSSNKYILLSFPTGRMHLFEINVGHFRNFKKNEVENYLKTYKFFPKKIYYSGFPFYSPLYRELCNLTNSANNSFSQGRFGIKQRIISEIFYFLFNNLSTREKYGDQFCGLFQKDE